MNGSVSIIVPVFDKEPYLEDCFDSIRNQAWKALEVIIIDDGSTDGSRTIIEQYSLLDPRFRMIVTAHMGPSSARNTGLEAATGEFVTFIDADDYVEPDYIENMVTSIGDAACACPGRSAGYRIRTCGRVLLASLVDTSFAKSRKESCRNPA